MVVLAADPHIVANMPGYFALGANTVASKVAEGGAQPLLLVGWHPAGVAEASADYVAGVAHATSYWASVDLPVVPSAVVWDALPGGLKDVAAANPTPGGAYLAAASIYSHLSGVSASTSDYAYSDSLATAALAGVQGAAGGVSVVGLPSKVSPFSPISTSARVLHYNHTGTRLENGILGGLKWVLAKANVQLINGGSPPIEFNYGRANTEFEANKRYKIDPAQFDHSMGFPMQDHSGYGNVTMLHGLDKRRYDLENGTDLGVARFMTVNAELPYARAIPIRTLFARMREVNPEQSGYSDGWHMNKNLDKAVGAYMYTLLTGHCALDAEPADPTSGAEAMDGVQVGLRDGLDAYVPAGQSPMLQGASWNVRIAYRLRVQRAPLFPCHSASRQRLRSRLRWRATILRWWISRRAHSRLLPKTMPNPKWSP